jgi:acetyl-CoA carboxylase alpha subunit
MPTRKEKAPEAPVLDFERPVVELQRKIATLKGRSRASSDLAREIRRIEERAEGLQRRIFSELSDGPTRWTTWRASSAISASCTATARSPTTAP